MTIKNLVSLVGFFKQSTEEMHANNIDDLNLNNSHQAEMMKHNVEFCPSNNIRHQFRKSSEVEHLTNDLELRKLQSEIQKLKNRLNQSRSPHYEHVTLKKREPFYDNSIQNSFSNFSDTLKAQRLSKKFKRLDFVKNPRDTINYFEEEMFNEGISCNTEKYRFLIEFWPKKSCQTKFQHDILIFIRLLL